MRLAHLSDLHFGRPASPERILSLKEDLSANRPQLIIITGDITDRGRVSQFRSAIDFLDQVGLPFIIVPGNREVSVSAFWEWMAPRLAMNRFRGFFGQSDRILWKSDEFKLAFFGLNSVHTFPSWPGKIARESRYWLRQQAAKLADYRKVLFLHHPVMPVIRASSFWAHTLSDAGELLNICTETGIILILQGHKHRSSVVEINVPERNARVVISAAGAPLASRWDAAYNLIEMLPEEMVVLTREFVQGRFDQTGVYKFPLCDGSGDGKP
jgi:3',5'-cyclic AMP phosphodiesterase CpdA